MDRITTVGVYSHPPTASQDPRLDPSYGVWVAGDIKVGGRKVQVDLKGEPIFGYHEAHGRMKLVADSLESGENPIERRPL